MVTLWEQRQPLPARRGRRLSCGRPIPHAPSRGRHDGIALDRRSAAAAARHAAQVSRGEARDLARGRGGGGRPAGAAHRAGVGRRGPAGAARPDRVVCGGLRGRRGLDWSRHGQLRGRRPRRGRGERPGRPGTEDRVGLGARAPRGSCADRHRPRAGAAGRRYAAHADRHGLQPPRGPAGGCGVFLLRQSPGGERDGRWTTPRPGPGSGGGHGEGGARRPDTAARGGSQYRRRTRARARDGGGADGGRGAVRRECEAGKRPAHRRRAGGVGPHGRHGNRPHRSRGRVRRRDARPLHGDGGARRSHG